MRRVYEDNVFTRAVSPTDRMREAVKRAREEGTNLRSHLSKRFERTSPQYNDDRNRQGTSESSSAVSFRERNDFHRYWDQEGGNPTYERNMEEGAGSPQYLPEDDVIELSDDEAPEPPRLPPASERRTLREPDNRGREQEMRRGNYPPNGTANNNKIRPRSDRRRNTPQMPNRQSHTLHPRNNNSDQLPPQRHQAPPQQRSHTATNAHRHPADVLRIAQLEEELNNMDTINRELTSTNIALQKKIQSEIQYKAKYERLQETLRRALDDDDRNSYDGNIQERDEDFHGSNASNSYRERSQSRESSPQQRNDDFNAERHQGQYERGQGPSTSRDY